MPLDATIDLTELPDKQTSDEAALPDVRPSSDQSSPMPDLSALPDKAIPSQDMSSKGDKETPTLVPTISQAPETSLWGSFKDVLHGMRFSPLYPFWNEWMKSRARKDADAAAMSVAIGEQLNVPPSVVYQNLPAFTKQLGIRGVPTGAEQAGMMLAPQVTIPAIASGLVTSPIATLTGLALYQTYSELESAAVDFKLGQSYRPFQGRRLSELLPADSTQASRDFVDMLDTMGGLLAGATGFGSPRMFPNIRKRLTRDVIRTYNTLPRDIYIHAHDLRAELQTGGVLPEDVMKILKSAGMKGPDWAAAVKKGATIRIPAEETITWQDKPWWARVKVLLRITPSPPVTKINKPAPTVEIGGKPTGEIIKGKRPIAGLLPAPVAGEGPPAAPGAQPTAPGAAQEGLSVDRAMADLNALQEPTDAQAAAIFDQATGVQGVEAAPSPPVMPEGGAVEAPPTPEEQMAQDRAIEQAVKLVAEQAPDLVPQMVERVKAAGYKEQDAKVVASLFIGLQNLGQRAGMTPEQIRDFAATNLPHIRRETASPAITPEELRQGAVTPGPQIYIRPSDVGEQRVINGEPYRVHTENHELLRGTIVTKTDLPAELYHVTTNAPAVRSSGMLKSMGPEVAGLGKGSSYTHQGVSTTLSLGTAKMIRRELLRAGKLARQPGSVPTYLHAFAAEDEKIHGLKPGALKRMAEEAATWWRYPHHGEKNAQLAMDAFRQYLLFRSLRAGVEDPILYLRGDLAKTLTPETTKIVRVKTSDIPDEALIRKHPISGEHLDEVMIHADVPVANEKAHYPSEFYQEALPPPPLTPYQEGYFSQLERVVDKKMPAKATADTIKRIVRDPQNAIKDEELFSTGLMSWLDTQQGQLTKADVMNYLTEHRIDIERVVLRTWKPEEPPTEEEDTGDVPMPDVNVGFWEDEELADDWIRERAEEEYYQKRAKELLAEDAVTIWERAAEAIVHEIATHNHFPEISNDETGDYHDGVNFNSTPGDALNALEEYPREHLTARQDSELDEYIEQLQDLIWQINDPTEYLPEDQVNEKAFDLAMEDYQNDPDRPQYREITFEAEGTDFEYIVSYRYGEWEMFRREPSDRHGQDLLGNFRSPDEEEMRQAALADAEEYLGVTFGGARNENVPQAQRPDWKTYMPPGGKLYRENVFVLKDWKGRPPEIPTGPTISHHRRLNLPVVAHTLTDIREGKNGQEIMVNHEQQSDVEQGIRKHRGSWTTKDAQLVEEEQKKWQAVVLEAQRYIDDVIHPAIPNIIDKGEMVDRALRLLDVLDTAEPQALGEHPPTAAEVLAWTNALAEFKSRISKINKAIKLIEGREGYPRLPFTGASKDWLMLVMKSAIRDAIDEGKDWVGWPYGMVATERWQQSKPITSFQYIHNADGTYNIKGHYVDESDPDHFTQVFHKEGVPLDEIAGKLRAMVEKREGDVIPNGWREIAISMDYGAEIMRGRYDLIAVNEVNKYIKKWGSKVQDVYLNPDENAAGEVSSTNTFTRGMLLGEKPIHAFRITPEMTEWIKEKGQAFFQPSVNEPRGKITFGQHGIDITLFRSADPSTLIHELGHLYLKLLGDMAALPTATEDLKADYSTVLNELNATPGQELTREQHEHFSRLWEAYFYDGAAPSPKMRSIFDKIKEWLRGVYENLKTLQVKMSPQFRRVLDKFFSTPDEQQTLANSAIVPAEDIGTKRLIRENTGQVKEPAPPVSELAQLKYAFIKAQRAAREAFRAGNKEGVAAENARMKDILARAKASKEARAAQAKRIAQVKKIKRAAVGKIAVDYQKKIADLFQGVDLSKPTEKTLERLKGLQAFIDREGVPLGISQAELNQLARLNEKTAFRDLSATFQEELLKTARRLLDLGALKYELQQNQADRELAAAVDTLVASTVNLEPKLSGEKIRTQEDNLKIGALQADLSSLHAFRVADRLDGNVGYSGENARLIKEELDAVMKAEWRSRTLLLDAQGELAALGLDKITDEQQQEMFRRVNVVLMVEQNARGQAQTLMDTYGMTDIPTLTAKERLLVTILRKYAGAQTDEIRTVYEDRENLPFPQEDNYFPISYERDQFESPQDEINPDRYRTKQVSQGFTQKRRPGVTLLAREDLLRVLEKGIVNQAWYVHVQPVLDRHSAMIRTPEFRAAAGETLWRWWLDQIDITARRGWTAQATHGGMARALRNLRMNVTEAVLPFKATSTLLQPFAVFPALAFATVQYSKASAAWDVFAETVKAWTNLAETRRYIASRPELTLRQAGEYAIEEATRKEKGVRGLRARAVRAGLKPLTFLDVITAAGAEKGFIRVLMKQGMSAEAAQQEAAFLMEAVSGSSVIPLRPHVLATGEGWRTLLLFQTFFLNQWGILREDILRSGFKAGGGWKKKLFALLALAIMIAEGISEQKARDVISSATRGMPTPQAEESLIKTVLLYIPRQIPLLGDLFQGEAVEPPTLRTAKEGAQGVSQVVSGKPIAGFEKLAEAMMILLLGMPGTSQAFDFLDGLLRQTKIEETKAATTRRRR